MYPMENSEIFLNINNDISLKETENYGKNINVYKKM